MTGQWISGARVEFINQTNNVINPTKSDANGRFQKNALSPAVYLIRVTHPDYQTRELIQTIVATRSNDIKEVPVKLVKNPIAVVDNTNPSPNPNPSPAPVTPTNAADTQQDNNAASDTTEVLVLNPRRDEAFNAFRVRTLPLGATTLTRTFDELATLLPGVNRRRRPSATGGPGVGGGVGTPVNSRSTACVRAAITSRWTARTITTKTSA